MGQCGLESINKSKDNNQDPIQCQHGEEADQQHLLNVFEGPWTLQKEYQLKERIIFS